MLADRKSLPAVFIGESECLIVRLIVEKINVVSLNYCTDLYSDEELAKCGEMKHIFKEYFH